MKRLYNAAGAVRGTLFCQSHNRRSVAATARRMDPVVRSALARVVREEDCGGPGGDLADLDAELGQAEASLRAAVEKETFLSLRSRQYRKALDARARTLRDERDALAADAVSSSGADEEEAAAAQLQLREEYELRTEQWEKDEDALKSVLETHTQILAACEQMRRTIFDLHKKKAALHRLNDQCQDFLAVAGEAHDSTTADLDATRSMEEGAAATADLGGGIAADDSIADEPTIEETPTAQCETVTASIPYIVDGIAVEAPELLAEPDPLEPLASEDDQKRETPDGPNGSVDPRDQR